MQSQTPAHRQGASPANVHALRQKLTERLCYLPLVLPVYMSQLVASDILWSDPSTKPGQVLNNQRFVGTRFGPDVTEVRRTECHLHRFADSSLTGCKQINGHAPARATHVTAAAVCESDCAIAWQPVYAEGPTPGSAVSQEFMRSNKVSLIIRSHEGPDARAKRPADDRMPSIDEGYCVDHDTPCEMPAQSCNKEFQTVVGLWVVGHIALAHSLVPSSCSPAPRCVTGHSCWRMCTCAGGKLVTLFSSPCYPMHTPKDEQPFHNKGAVLHLTAPDYATPDVQQFEAVLPRPPVSRCAKSALTSLVLNEHSGLGCVCLLLSVGQSITKANTTCHLQRSLSRLL